MHDSRLPTILVWIITTVWVISLTLDATVRIYDPPASVHALMMAAAGWSFGQRFINKGGGT